MTTSRERAAAVLDRVETMTILEDVAARDLSEGFVGLSIRGAEASERWAGLFELPTDDVALGSDGSLLLRSPCRGAGTSGTRRKGGRSVLDVPVAEPAVVEAARIAAGTPRWGADMGPRTLPPELGPAFEASHVSLAKGCYTGQEVLMRMHTRGHTNRTWVGLVSEKPLAVGASVLHEGQEVGRVSSASSYPVEVGYVAAGTLRNGSTAEGTRVEAGGVAAEVRTMPIRAAS